MTYEKRYLSRIFQNIIIDYRFKYHEIKDWISVYEYSKDKYGYSDDDALAYSIGYLYRKQVPDDVFRSKAMSCMDDMMRIIEDTPVDLEKHDNESIRKYVFNKSRESFKKIYNDYTACKFDEIKLSV